MWSHTNTPSQPAASASAASSATSRGSASSPKIGRKIATHRRPRTIRGRPLRRHSTVMTAPTGDPADRTDVTSPRAVGPGLTHGVPAGPAQPGRRRGSTSARAPGRSCSSRRARSTPGSGCCGPATTATSSTSTRAGARRSSPGSSGSSCGRGASSTLERSVPVRGRPRRARRRRPPDRLAGPRRRPTCFGDAAAARRRRDGARRRGLRGAAHRPRRAGDGRRAHRGHDPGRGRAVGRRRVGELHQGLLHRPGAGGPHRQPRRQRAPPPADPRRRGPRAGAGHRASSSTARSSAGSRARPGRSPSPT